MIHPCGLQTTDYEPSEVFEPNGWQIESAARKALDDIPPVPRRISLRRWFWTAITLVLLSIFGTYFVLSKVLG